MSATPINLNKVRKARARSDKKVRADTNAVAFGRSKAEKNAARQEDERRMRALDGAVLGNSGNEGGRDKT